MIVVSAGWEVVELDLDRLANAPSPKGVALLNGVLSKGFGLTQTYVHVRTGSLKSSGKSSTSTNEADHSWSGQIRYGGPSLGVNNPVDYAIYEKRRHGSHDFFIPLATLHEDYVAAILEEMRG